MSVVVITGSSGLVGSAAARFFHGRGFDVVGVDNNLRRQFFGTDGSVEWNTRALIERLPHFRHVDADIRDRDAIFGLFARYGTSIECVIHAAAQPSHDWAARDPFTDFSVNANGTLTMLEAARAHCPEAAFIFTSTNKVYGDTPNALPLVEKETRWEVSPSHRYAEHGIDESMSVDASKHSLFGASKLAADVLAQEYGRYFGMKTGVFRAGCLTGPAHAGAELHGFLAYLVRCAVSGRKYTVYGYGGKQVRDNIHAEDLVSAFWHFFESPRAGEVYNIGGARKSSCSVLEAIRLAEEAAERKLEYQLEDQARSGDHIWWISDTRKFQSHYPEWTCRHDLRSIVAQIADAARERYARVA
jgi:CDP-paratose 2-epimerase